jgi:CRP-like cAMP-binding protein
MIKLDDYVLDTLMRDLVGHDRRPVCYLIYVWLAAEQQRAGKPVRISYSDLAESIGVSRSSAQAAIAWLVRRRLISVARSHATATPSYAVHTPWKR